VRVVPGFMPGQRLPILVAALLVLVAFGTPAAAVCPDGVTIQQEIGADYLRVAAEYPTTTNTSWDLALAPGAYHNRILSPETTAAGAVTYQIQFRKAGTYRLYIRGRGPGGGSNSAWVPGLGDPEADPRVAASRHLLEFGTGEWQWRNDGVPSYVISESKLNRPLAFRIAVREALTQLDELIFVLEGQTVDRDAPYFHAQAGSSDSLSSLSLAFQAEDYDHRNGTNGWSTPQSDDLAHGRAVLVASSSANNTQPAPYASYRVKFNTAGTYQLYIRGRAPNTASNAVFLPSSLALPPSPVTGQPSPGPLPSQVATVPVNGSNQWGWVRCASCAGLTVTAADVGEIRELRIGVSEPGARIDSVVAVPTTRTAKELDALVGYWEGEFGSFTGSIGTPSHTGASNGERASSFDGTVESITFDNLPATNEIWIRYSLETDSMRQASLYLNGVEVDTVTFSPTGSWDSYATQQVGLRGFTGGTLKLQIDPDDRAANDICPGDSACAGCTDGNAESLCVMAQAERDALCPGDAATAEDEASASIDRISLPERGEECLILGYEDYDDAETWVGPGRTLVLADEAMLVDGRLTVDESGTADHPIVIRGQFPDSTVLTQGATFELNGDHIVVKDLTPYVYGNWPSACDWCVDGEPCACAFIYLNGSHDRVTNLAFDAFYPSDPDFGYNMVLIAGHFNRVDHSLFSEQLTSGATIQVESPDEPDEPRYTHINRNYFYNRPTSASNGYEWVRSGGGISKAGYSSRVTISENLFDSFMHQQPENASSGEGEVISNKSSDSRIFYNTFVNVHEDLTMRNGQRAFVVGNRFVDEGAVRVYGAGHRILNNYFDSAADYAIRLGNANYWNGTVHQGYGCTIDEDGPAYEYTTNILVAFNTFTTQTKTILQVGDTAKCRAPNDVTVAYNYAPGGGTAPATIRYDPEQYISGNYYTEADLFEKITHVDNHFRDVEYLFLGSTTGSFPAGIVTSFDSSALEEKVQPTNACGIATDYQGQARQGNLEIGADENATGPVYVPELDASMTGPTWL
jgi:hypothetical protein